MADGPVKGRVTSRVESVPYRPDPLQALAVAHRRADGLSLLHSAAAHPDRGRWSILCAEPVRLLQADRTTGADPFVELADQTRALRLRPGVGPDLPLRAGWVGYLGYEAGRFLERLPANAKRDVDLPVARMGLYGAAAVYDHMDRQWYVAGADLPGGTDGLSGQDGLRFWKEVLRDAQRQSAPVAARAAIPSIAMPDVDACLASLPASLSPAQFKGAVARAIDYIRAGDIYQVNLSRRLTAPLPAEPLEVYMRLCQANPAWYAAYLAFGDKAVLSSSPELFLHVRDGRAITRPIKGTRPRLHRPALDAAAREALPASEKDRAELAMIVDLMRNDLGRVCRFGSVRVLEPFALEEHPTVYHLVSTIEGRLAEGLDAIDMLRATFPGGSITGAPKIRAMQIIDELEPVVRSAYCGCIGCIGLDGAMTMNIAIRTLVVDGPRVHLYTGGGIVADSDPELELRETMAKARGMGAALASLLRSGAR